MRLPASLFHGLPAAFKVLWLGTLINRLGGFVVPFLAIYLSQERGYSVERVGLVASLYGAGHFVSSPVGGWLADRVGRRRVMLASLTLSAGAVLWLGFAGRGLEVAAAVFLVSFFGGMYGPASSAAVVDLVGPAGRARAFGLIYWAINLGFSGAMIMAGLLIGFGYLTLFIADAATTLAAAVLVALYVPETRPTEAKTAASAALTPFRDRRFALFFLLTFAIGLIYTQSNCTMPVDMANNGISPAQYGYLVALNGVLVAVLQPLAGSWILAKPPALILAAAALLTGLGFGLNAVVGTVPLYVLAIVLWTLGEILGAPVGPSVVAELAPSSLRGTYQGAFHMSWGMASMFAPMGGAFVMGRSGAPALWGACALLGAVVALGHLRVTARFRSENSLVPPEAAEPA